MMTHVSGLPSVRELIAEFASIEDRMRSTEALVHGGSRPPRNPEQLRLAHREQEILEMLRRHSTTR